MNIRRFARTAKNTVGRNLPSVVKRVLGAAVAHGKALGEEDPEKRKRMIKVRNAVISGKKTVHPAPNNRNTFTSKKLSEAYKVYLNRKIK